MTAVEGRGVSGGVEHSDLFPGQVFVHRSRRLALVEVVVDTSGIATFAFFDNRLPFLYNGSRRGNRLTLLIEVVVDTARVAAFPFFNGGNDSRLSCFDGSSPGYRLHRSANCRASNRLRYVHSDRGT